MIEILYGRQAVLEALRAGRRHARRVLLAEGVQERGIILEIIDAARQRRIPVQMVRRSELDRLGPVHHQGVVLETSSYPYADLAEILKISQERDEPPFLLMLDHLQDPQNLGTLLRTAEAVGIHGVIIPKRRAVGITPAVCNTSAGAVEHLRVAQVANLSQTISQLQQDGIWVVGLERTEGALPLEEADLTGPLALVVGSEGRGVSRLVRERCDWLVMLPMCGRITSLNAAVAGSIVLYAAWRARERTAATSE
ncbi:MAG TPA: 23S rRNA (guanosine(2251)-2'-O)-methyltransferase RlmB [Caldilineae bacterium]|nr:23S rRNA (guanosine(2251)-2'-O)-methyltransferase RlmB [Caldilineae bacterium]